MVHIGDSTARDEASAARRGELTRFLLKSFEPGDILTHLCTPNSGRVLDQAGRPYPEVAEARANGVVLDSALGRGNFGIEVARRQADLGLFPDTISSDLTALGQTFHSLLECMAKFMSIGYTLADVVKATTASAASALGLQHEIGSISVGREADLSIIDVVEGDFTFTDTTGREFRGGYGLVPVRTLKAGEEFSPGGGRTRGAGCPLARVTRSGNHGSVRYPMSFRRPGLRRTGSEGTRRGGPAAGLSSMRTAARPACGVRRLGG